MIRKQKLINLCLIIVLTLSGCQTYRLYQIHEVKEHANSQCYLWPKQFSIQKKYDYWVDPKSMISSTPLNLKDLIPPTLGVGSVSITTQKSLKKSWDMLIKRIKMFDDAKIDGQNDKQKKLIARVPFYGDLRRVYITLRAEKKQKTKVSMYVYGKAEVERSELNWLMTIYNQKVALTKDENQLHLMFATSR
jgi:hypothetical protein